MGQVPVKNSFKIWLFCCCLQRNQIKKCQVKQRKNVSVVKIKMLLVEAEEKLYLAVVRLCGTESTGGDTFAYHGVLHESKHKYYIHIGKTLHINMS